MRIPFKIPYIDWLKVLQYAVLLRYPFLFLAFMVVTLNPSAELWLRIFTGTMIFLTGLMGGVELADHFHDKEMNHTFAIMEEQQRFIRTLIVAGYDDQPRDTRPRVH